MLSTTLTGGSPDIRLHELRLAAERMILVLIGLHAPIVLVTGLITGTNLIVALVLWFGVALASLAVHLTSPGTQAARATIGVALTVMPALLVLELDGQPWQADAHMYFFASVAIGASMLDMWAVAAAAAFTAVHHLVLNFLLPAAVFPGGGDLLRVVFHAVILISETAALIWLTRQACRAIEAAGAAGVALVHAAEARAQDDALAAERNVTQRQHVLTAMATTVEAASRDAVELISRETNAIAHKADTMAELTLRVSENAEQVSHAAGMAVASVESVGVASEALTQSISQIADKVADASHIAQRAATSGTLARERIQSLSEATIRIGTVLQMIDSLAGQTNLLALNATIEAARAGDAGKGFAVVASEVKALARKTASSTAEISRQAEDIRAATDNAVSVVEDVGRALQDIAAVSAILATAVEQQAAATQAINHNVRETTEAVQAVTTGIRKVTQDVAENRAFSTDLRTGMAGVSTNVASLSSRIAQIIRGSMRDVA